MAILALACALSAAFAAESDSGLVGERGDPANLRFDGAVTFTPEDLRRALTRNTAFIRASHPQAPLQPFLDMLQEKIRDGYQNGGFPDPQVTVTVDTVSGWIKVAIHEGARYRCGQVKVTGTTPALTGALIAHLSKPAPQDADAQLGKPKHAPAATASAHTTIMGANETSPSADITATATFQTNGPYEALTDTGDSTPQDPVWRAGDPASFGKPAFAQIEAAADACFAQRGLFFPRLNLKVETNAAAATADLIVEVFDAGPQGTISALTVSGSTRSTTNEILNFLGLKVGQPVTSARISEAQDKMWRSGRFLESEVTPEQAAEGDSKAGGVRLNIKVREDEVTPKLGVRLSPKQQALLRVCDWVSAFRSHSQDLVLSVEFARTNGTPAFALELIISPTSGVFVRFNDASRGADYSCSAFFASGTFGLVSAHHAKLLIPELDAVPQASISLLPAAAGAANPFDLNFSAGFKGLSDSDVQRGAAPHFDLTLKFAPVAFLHRSEDTNYVCKLEAGVLRMDSPESSLRADAATGRITDWTFRSSSNLTAHIRFAGGAFDQARQEWETAAKGLPDTYSPRHPFSSMADFLAVEAARWQYLGGLATNLPPARRAVAVSAVARLVSFLVFPTFDEAMIRAKASATNSFTIPLNAAELSVPRDASVGAIAGLVFQIANETFPKNSWPWTIAHEAVFVLANEQGHTDGELKRLYQSYDVGPLGCLALAELLAWLKSPAAPTFAARGMTLLTADDFQTDCGLLLRGNSGLARNFARMAATLRDMPAEDVAALGEMLPGAESALVKQSAQALRTAPAAPLDQVLAPALNDYWENSLHDRVRGALRRISTGL